MRPVPHHSFLPDGMAALVIVAPDESMPYGWRLVCQFYNALQFRDRPLRDGEAYALEVMPLSALAANGFCGIVEGMENARPRYPATSALTRDYWRQVFMEMLEARAAPLSTLVEVFRPLESMPFKKRKPKK